MKLIGRFGRHATASDMLEFLGLPRTAKLPKEGMPKREIQGVRVYVKPFVSNGSRRTVKHRVIAICTCGRHIPTGRINQHRCQP